MDQLTHNVRRANWLNIMNQCQKRPANVTVRQWLKDNDINEKSYYYWLRKFRKESYDQMQLPVTAESPAEISFVEIAAPAVSEKVIPTQKLLNIPVRREFFAWVKQQVDDCAVPPKSKTGQGLNFIINQEKYLKVFLEDGDVSIDNSASERAIRTFCLGKKNWMFHNTAKGASASAMVYSISETAKLNNLRPYYYFKYILTELPKLSDERGNIDPQKLDYLMPWSDSLPDECRKLRRP